MKIFNSFKSFNIFKIEKEFWDFEIHKHNFFEIIYIEKGSGQHILNDVEIKYKKGDLFIISPNDYHYFKIEKKTDFIFLKFNESLFIEESLFFKHLNWEILIKGLKNNTTINAIHCKKINSKNIRYLIKLIITEYEESKIKNKDLILHLFYSLLIKLNYNTDCQLKEVKDEKATLILNEIRELVINNKKIDFNTIATKFNISDKYLSIFIKNQTGISLKRHIIETKIQIVENLLNQNNLNINEIAQKTGFIDASHLNKIFKKYRNSNPSEIKKQ